MRFSPFLFAFLVSCGSAEQTPSGPSRTPVDPGLSYFSATPPQDVDASIPKVRPAAPLTLVTGDLLHITVSRRADPSPIR
jgi:hypothetical protein